MVSKGDRRARTNVSLGRRHFKTARKAEKAARKEAKKKL